MQKTVNAIETWNSLSSGRREWEPVVNAFLLPISSSMIRQLDLSPASNVLDVATGMGEPGLTIAALFPSASVVGIDISDEMLGISHENAIRKNIFNFETVCCDVNSMPFPDNHFDAIICRNGIMFFDDIEAGLKEMSRVLRPNGRVTVSAWGLLEKNLWINVVLDAITAVTNHKAYNKHIPGMFYCMQPGFMTDWFEEVDMQDIDEQELTGIIEFSSIEEHWRFVTTVSAAVVEALKKVDPDSIAAVREIVGKKISTHIIRDRLYFQWNTRITSGTKRDAA
jgi:ubiquinone/menaquinone biosynthesis C-methylase UbiE